MGLELSVVRVGGVDGLGVLVVDCVVDSVLLSGLVTVFVTVVGSGAFSGSLLEQAERHSTGIVSERTKTYRLCI